MKDASEKTLVLAEDLSEQFFGEQQVVVGRRELGIVHSSQF
jgi:hypothetical protein